MLPSDLARPPLRQTKAILKHPNRLTPPRRAHQFPFAISFNAAFSKV